MLKGSRRLFVPALLGAMLCAALVSGCGGDDQKAVTIAPKVQGTPPAPPAKK